MTLPSTFFSTNVFYYIETNKRKKNNDKDKEYVQGISDCEHQWTLCG